MQTLMQNNMVINYLKPTDHSGSSVSKSNTKSISFKKYRKATFIVNCGAMTEATTNFQVYQAKSPGATGSSISSTALTLDHYWTNKSSTSVASSGAVFTRTAATSSKMVVDSTNSAVYVFEVRAAALNTTSGYDCIVLGISGISAAANMQVTAILSDPRYAEEPMAEAFD